MWSFWYSHNPLFYPHISYFWVWRDVTLSKLSLMPILSIFGHMMSRHVSHMSHDCTVTWSWFSHGFPMVSPRFLHCFTFISYFDIRIVWKGLEGSYSRPFVALEPSWYPSVAGGLCLCESCNITWKVDRVTPATAGSIWSSDLSEATLKKPWARVNLNRCQ